MPLSFVDRSNMRDKLRQDIRNACKELEKFGEDTMVISVSGDVISTLGSPLGLQFLKGLSAVKADFRKLCNRHRKTTGNNAKFAATLQPISVKAESSEQQVDPADASIDAQEISRVLSPTTNDEFDDYIGDTADTEVCDKYDLEDNKSPITQRNTVHSGNVDAKTATVTPRRSSRRLAALTNTPLTTNGRKENRVVEKVPVLKLSLKKNVIDSTTTTPTHTNVPEVKSEDKIYLCHICKQQFSVHAKFRNHLQAHRDLSCHVCKTVFKTAEKRAEHKQLHIDKGEYHECNICKRAFKDTILLDEHVLTIHRSQGELQQSETYMANVDAAINYFDQDTNVEVKTTLKQIMSDAKPPYRCPICRQSFDKRVFNLRRHLLRHSTERLVPCRVCERKFRSTDNLRRHMVKHAEKPFSCSKCGCGFLTQLLLDSHQKFICAPGEKPYLLCDLCDHKAFSQLALERHRNQHLGIKLFKCEECGKGLATKDSLGRHKIVHHQNETPWECDVCGKKFKLHDTLRKHQKSHQKPRYHCTVCQKGCTELGNLKKHMLSHTKDKNFICDACGKAYGRKSLLDNHQRLHTGEKPYVCEIKSCGKKFRSYANLKQHKTTHSSAKEHICDFCGKEFKSRGRMNHHRKFHTVDYRWPCEYCTEKFNSIFLYKSHLAKRHPDKKEEVEEKHNIRLYQCDLCHKMYGDKEDLTRHYYIHSGLKPFKCGHCGKAFNDKSNLRQHEKIHTGEKTNRCGRCYKSFIHPRSLKIHMRNVHNFKDAEVGDDTNILTIDDVNIANNDLTVNHQIAGSIPMLCIQAINEPIRQSSIQGHGSTYAMDDMENKAAIRHMSTHDDMDLHDPERQAVIQGIHTLTADREMEDRTPSAPWCLEDSATTATEMRGQVLQDFGRLGRPMLGQLLIPVTSHTQLTSMQTYSGPDMAAVDPPLMIVENY